MSRDGGDVRRAVERELERIKERSAELAESALAASALALAGEMDDETNSATSKAMCAGRLHDALDRLRELTPTEDKTDGVNEVQRKREQRRARAAAAASRSRS